MFRRLALSAVFTACLAVAGAHAFGTTSSQGSEHERITRHALACAYGNGKMCWEAKTVEEFAGSKGDFGAIGIPDRGDLIFKSRAHCDNGDYMDIPNYPRSKKEAHKNLEDCRAWIEHKFEEAVIDAGALVDSKGKLRSSEMSIHCVFLGGFKGDAKCNVLEDLGIMMHASQDFYSHTNFTDVAAPGATSITNPPGKNITGPSNWIAIDNAPGGYPTGLISGCFKAIPESLYCKGHVRHENLNKDEGQIDPTIGKPETTRGKVGLNFQHAVEAAIQDSHNKWTVFQAHLNKKYGSEKGKRMACAMAHDDPMKTCS